jgi:predicted Zn-dependent protease
MKKFLTAFFAFLFLASTSYAINLGDGLKQIAGDKNVSDSLGGKLDKVIKENQDKLNSYTKQLDEEIVKIKSQAKEAQDAIDKLKAIKANADVLKTIRADVVAVHAYLTEAVKALKDAQTTLEQSATIVATKEVK